MDIVRDKMVKEAHKPTYSWIGKKMAPLKSLGSHCFGAGDSILVRIVLILLRLVRHCSTGVLHCCQLVHIVLVFAVPCKPLLWRGTD